MWEKNPERSKGTRLKRDLIIICSANSLGVRLFMIVMKS